MNQDHTLFFHILDLQRDTAARFKMETQRWDTTLLVDTKAYRTDKTVLEFCLIITEISKPRTLKTLSGMKSRKKRRQERIRGNPENFGVTLHLFPGFLKLFQLQYKNNFILCVGHKLHLSELWMFICFLCKSKDQNRVYSMAQFSTQLPSDSRTLNAT